MLRKCPLCTNDMAETRIEERLSRYLCSPCDHHHNELRLDCSNCGNDYAYFGGYAECPECTHTEDFDDITSLLEARREFSTVCFGCKRKGTVIRYGGTILCVGCLDWSEAPK